MKEKLEKSKWLYVEQDMKSNLKESHIDKEESLFVQYAATTCKPLEDFNMWCRVRFEHDGRYCNDCIFECMGECTIENQNIKEEY